MVVSMLSERMVLRALLMLAEWASTKHSTSLDEKIVIEIRTKLVVFPSKIGPPYSMGN